jgi:hypothetical protein
MVLVAPSNFATIGLLLGLVWIVASQDPTAFAFIGFLMVVAALRLR